MISKEQAEELFARLNDRLNDAEAILVEVIKAKAWEPLGYPSFVDAWNARIHCRLATTAMKGHVIYAALDEGLDRDEIVATFRVPDSQVDLAIQAKRQGIPPEGYTWVRQHPRRRERAPDRIIRVEFSPSEYAYLRDIAKQHKIDLAELARKALWEAVGHVLSDAQAAKVAR